MRIAHRVRSLERKAAGGADCQVCRGAGWPAVLVAGAPKEWRPADKPAGCRACGRIGMVSWIGLGESPTAEEVRRFWEAI